MPLGKFVWKIKRKNDYLLPSLTFGPHGLFPARPVHPPLPFPAQPSRRSRPSSRAQPGTAAQPRASVSPAQQPRLRPHQATARAQPLTAQAHLSAPPPTSRSPRAATVAHERRRGSTPPRASAASNSSPTPPRAPGCPRSHFRACQAPRKAATAAAMVTEIRHRRARDLRADSLLRAASVSISPLVSFAVLPSISPCISLLIFLAS